VVSCHANRAINRTAERKLCTSFAISLILSKYNSIRKTFPGQKYIGSDKQVQTTNIFSTCEQSILQQCSYALLLIGVRFLFIYFLTFLPFFFSLYTLLFCSFLYCLFVRYISLVYAPTSFPTFLSFYVFLSFLFLFFLHFCHYILHFLTLLFSVLMSSFIYHLCVLQHSFSSFNSSSNYYLAFLKFVVYVSVSSSQFLPPLSNTLITCNIPTPRYRYFWISRNVFSSGSRSISKPGFTELKHSKWLTLILCSLTPCYVPRVCRAIFKQDRQLLTYNKLWSSVCIRILTAEKQYVSHIRWVCVCFDFLTTSSDTYLILSGIQSDIITNVHRYSGNVPLMVSYFNKTWIFTTDFLKIIIYEIS